MKASLNQQAIPFSPDEKRRKGITSASLKPPRMVRMECHSDHGQIKGILDKILCGDAKFLLKQMPANSVDLVVTSPPYYLQRNYNGSGMGVGHEKTVEAYIDSLLETFEEAVRVVKDAGNIVYNIGDKYLESSLSLVPYRFAIAATERFPVRLVNNITWLKKNPTPRQFTRRLVSSTEPFFHFAKGADYYYSPENFLPDSKPKAAHRPTSKMGMRYRKLIEESDLPAALKKKANEALDAVIQEVVSGQISGYRMKIRGIHAEAFGGQEGGRKIQMEKNGFTIIRLLGGQMKRDVVESQVESIPGIKHSAVFPLSIIKEMIRLLAPKGGVVVDPYVGSGTTAVAALEEDCHFVGMDIDPLYCGIAKERIAECRKNLKR